MREFYCQESRYHKMPLFFCSHLSLMLRHCQAVWLKWYVHLHQNNLNTSCIWALSHRERMKKKCLEFWIGVFCLLWIGNNFDDDDKANSNQWLGTTKSVLISSSFVMCYSLAHSHHTNDDEDDKSIENEQNSMKRKKIHLDDCVWPQVHIFLIFIFFDKSNLTILWIQFDRLSCNMTCNIYFYVMLLPGFKTCVVCLMHWTGLRTMSMIYYCCLFMSFK